ncbi:MAG: hypothetical protein AAFU68_02850 [Pseudomonadota bacterium]
MSNYQALYDMLATMPEGSLGARLRDEFEALEQSARCHPDRVVGDQPNLSNASQFGLLLERDAACKERDRLRAENAKLKAVLQSIALWDVPQSGRRLKSDGSVSFSFGAAYGSEGERAWAMEIARAALESDT